MNPLPFIPANFQDTLLRSIVCACALSVGGPLRGQPVDQVELPGLGFFGDEDGSWIEIEATDEGSRVEYFKKAGEIFPPNFVVTWDSQGWTKLTFIEVTTEGDPDIKIQFSPFGTPLPIGAGSEVILHPREWSDWGFSLGITPAPSESRTGRFILEYSIVHFDTPIPGDFNFSGSVDFADFLILSTNFEKFKFDTRWEDGDATLDGQVTFEDFLILSANFGAVREPQFTAVPEPSSVGLLGLALCGLCPRNKGEPSRFFPRADHARP